MKNLNTFIKVGELLYDELVPNSRYIFTKIEGGEVSASISILSGNYVQTTDSLSVHNYSASNGFIQAVATKYGDASIGSKAYCILSVYPADKALLISGDFQYSDIATSSYTNDCTFGQILGTGSSCPLKYTSKDPDNAKNAVLSDLLWSCALSNLSESQFGSLTEIEHAPEGIKLHFDRLPANFNKLTALTRNDYINQFINRNEDNALYVRGLPLIGNIIPPQFDCQHIEGGSSKAICKYTHAEGRDTLADGRYAHAEGSQTIAGGLASHAEGQTCQAVGTDSHAEGRGSKAFGDESHAAGYYSTAQHKYSWCWNGIYNYKDYKSAKVGSFNVNPQDGLSGFYIGTNNFIECVLSAVKSMNNTQITEFKNALGIPN